MTQFIGLIGYPLKHSISPDFQQAALAYHKLDMRYEAWEVRAEDLPATVNKLRQPQNLGANITVPYKEMVIGLIDEVEEFARIIGAVNTVVNRSGRLKGFNTDSSGFLKALREDAGFEPSEKKVLILGAGGAARAIGFSLVQEKVGTLVFTDLYLEKAKKLAGALVKFAADSQAKINIEAVQLSSANLAKVAVQCKLIVNCTTVGMKYSPDETLSPLTSDLIPKDALVYDLVYNPSRTPLLRMAEVAGARTIGGLPMLVYQGAASFKIWTGREAPLDIMMTAARKALVGKGD
ncbi:MAG: shikimate dehydrogenase [Dehalococcoidia bacterium]|nr:shikimate dehydrogenase [Dehalococcoidia bacterium]